MARMADKSYISLPPYLVTYQWEAHSETWNVPGLDAALDCFWQDTHLSAPLHREIYDSNGLMIAREVNRPIPAYRFALTKEVGKRMKDRVAVEDRDRVGEILSFASENGGSDGDRW